MKRKNNLTIALLLIYCLVSCTTRSNAQKITEKWEYSSSYGKSYYLERKWVADTIFADKYFFDDSEIFWSDTFYLRNKECFFKRGNIYYPYLSPSSFEKGDTIRYYEQEAVNTSGSLFMIRDFYYPDKQSLKNDGLLGYIYVSPFDDPKHTTSRIYFDTKRNLVTKIITDFGVRHLVEK